VRKKVRETALQAPRSEKEEVLQASEQGLPCSPQRGGHSGAGIHTQPMEDPTLEEVDTS